MKRNIWIGLAVALLLGISPMLSAQSSKVMMRVPTTTSVTGTVTVSIPFAFSLEGKTFPEGEYTMQPLTDRTVAIRDSGGKQAVVALTNSVSNGNEISAPKLVFHRYGGQAFLTQAWLRQSDIGREFHVSPDEIRMAREYSQDQVTLIAKR